MVVMEGLIELGYTVFSNDFRRELIISPDISRESTIILHDNAITFSSKLTEGILIVDSSQGLGPYGDLLSKLGSSRPIAYVNMDDGVNLVDFPITTVAFCTHQNKNARRIGNIFPIPFGLSKSLIRFANESDLLHKGSRATVIDNFRSTFQQGVRNFCYLSLVPHLKRQLTVQSGILDSASYRSLLASSHAVLCYGGEIFRSFENNPGLPVPAIMRNFAHLSADPVILRWDSWRFWECCAFGCAPIMLDFDYYGLVLDQNPVPFLHYIPVRFGEEKFLAEEIGDRLNSDPNFLLNIGMNARNWAMRHYSPAAIASYVLRKIQDFYGITSFSLDTPS